MTRKDYVKIAAAIRPTIETCDADDATLSEWMVAAGIANDIADVFQADNPLFDRSRFLEACGL